ncbi:leucine-rich repeat-containing protein 57 isoform X2 [Hyalella azteca]|uniref:Leucine-rich repeat-containing protein 57 isoform X1 n=1 Tax=Hyalella azteca TaxID=294128 RepID=A0A8B7PBV5_HYAAZ|nr:leucine-rich repeat-containing protein 57 isoform X1 [Hyalella azteca]XP_018023481.1 leucine-rich repeat-containing protein 57 isoform X1 [Hyalella azteca]XP_018023482.1 leucine-rich repeat-containing protein 57 isoform X2 [Hyalella azteca]
MGQSASSNGKVKQHLETASKTGALVLTDRKLTEVPDLGAVAGSLRTLDLSNNKLTALPPTITNISTLKNFQLNNNKISSLPADIGRLGKLETLSVQHNCLTALPPSIAQLNHLKTLVLSGNGLEQLPVEVCGLPHLDLLDLSCNRITAVPDAVATLNALELNLNQNQISSISDKMGECPRLKTLRLEENCLQLSALPLGLLTDSQVSLLCLTGNLFSSKQLEETEGYDKYMERYTATKKKMF